MALSPSDCAFGCGVVCGGTYSYWIDQRNNPLTAIAGKDGDKPKVKQVRVVSGETVGADFACVPTWVRPSRGELGLPDRCPSGP